MREAKTNSQRKKLERDNWKASGGCFKEIKFTKEGYEKLIKGCKKKGFKSNWEFIDYLLKNTCD